MNMNTRSFIFVTFTLLLYPCFLCLTPIAQSTSIKSGGQSAKQAVHVTGDSCMSMEYGFSKIGKLIGKHNILSSFCNDKK